MNDDLKDILLGYISNVFFYGKLIGSFALFVYGAFYIGNAANVDHSMVGFWITIVGVISFADSMNDLMYARSVATEIDNIIFKHLGEDW
jgi:Ca2+/Na+ antiporter